jgi:GTP-binding protein HflX
MNVLTQANVYAKNELFATLDPTARKFKIDGIEFLLVDTVGFLQDLPHNLIEAFKSTLESALNCDLALIVCDAMGEYDIQINTTIETLKEMQFNSPYLLVMNKSESLSDFSVLPFGSIAISAKEQMGIENLKQEILKSFRNEFIFCELFVPYEKNSIYAAIKSLLYEQSVTFLEDGQKIQAAIPCRYSEKFNEFIKCIQTK